MPRLKPAGDASERPQKYERRKSAILAAAVEVINHKGVRGMTMGDVAGQLGMVPTAVGYYFRRKEDLAAACFLQAIEFFERLIAGAAQAASAEASLRHFFEDFAVYLAAVERGRADPIATFNDVRTIHDSAVDAAYTEMFRSIRRVFSVGDKSELARLHRNARTHLVISQAFWAVFWLKRYEPEDYPRLMSRMVDILVNGLAATPGPWAPKILPTAEGRGEPGSVSQEAFLRAATEMINEHGYLGASVSRICAHLNVSKGSFYHHNETKDDLVGQCFDRTLGLVRRIQIAAERQAATGLESLVSATATLVAGNISGDAPLLRMSALTAVPEDMQAALIQRIDRTSARFASIASDGIADGSIRPIDANVAAQMITVTINASAELHHWAPGATAENVSELYVQPLFTGLFAKSA